MRLYRILSVLLSYPEPELLESVDDIDQALTAYPHAQDALGPLLALLRGNGLIALQENYVATFDRNRSHSLHLFEHVHGESRDRGQAMVDLLQTYRDHGFEPAVSELPDHVPLFLEFLGLVPHAQSQPLLDDAIHVLAALGARLASDDSAYAGVFAALRARSTVTPRAQAAPPVRDMDEAMETFGTGPDGVEPLLRPMASGTHAVRFHPSGAAPR